MDAKKALDYILSELNSNFFSGKIIGEVIFIMNPFGRYIMISKQKYMNGIHDLKSPDKNYKQRSISLQEIRERLKFNAYVLKQ